MNTETLAPVYLDNQPVTLKEPRPKVSAILFAGGKANATDVKWLKSSSDTQGKPLRLEEVVDRTTEPTKAIYLTCASKGAIAVGVAGASKPPTADANAPFQPADAAHDAKPETRTDTGSGTILARKDEGAAGSPRSFDTAARPKARPYGQKNEAEDKPMADDAEDKDDASADAKADKPDPKEDRTSE